MHRRVAGELGADQVVLKASDQAGRVYDLPLFVGDRVRLFAWTNTVCADRSRGILGNNGSVLEVREIGAAGVTLRNAAGREGLVAWDTLRDRQSGRIKLSYGDVLTIGATQGLTSTEHIEAMPAGMQAVNANKAYTSGSRHRRATYLVAADGAERREIAARRPPGDAQPIREADVWLNMGRNLSRQPEQDSALGFLARAHEVQRGAVGMLQTGLQPSEQREVDGMAPTTLAQGMQQRRVMSRVAGLAVRLAGCAEEQQHVVERLGGIAPATKEMVAKAVERLQPVIQQVVERVRNKREKTAMRVPQAEAEIAVVHSPERRPCSEPRMGR